MPDRIPRALTARGRRTLDVGGADAPLTFEVSARVAERNNVAAGAEVSVSLLASGIHVMPETHAGR